MSLKNDNENLFNILYVEQKDSGNWKTPELFSENLTTILNEGPATFSPGGDTIFYSRNNKIEGKFKVINDPSNTLGIFSAIYIEGKWINITPFPFNSEEYSIGTPALSPDGTTLYFASDMPGGYGGTDIYYSNREGSQWSKPVNLGGKVNSTYNESYPFASKSGKLFYSSDKPGGYGGKDIYYSVQQNGNWASPILLKAEINSKADDYGIVTDINMDRGFFSSNRKGVANIYSFITEIPQIDPCIEQKPFLACFDFSDERYTDSLHLEYEWDFGHGIKQQGVKVRQCFNRPGSYSAVLTIIHKLADSVFETKSTYDFEVPEPDNIYIFSDKQAIVGKPIKFFSTLDNNIPAENYWSLNGENQSISNNFQYTFKEEGSPEVSLGIVFPKNEDGYAPKRCIKSRFDIFADEQEMVTQTYPLIYAVSEQKNTLRYKQPASKNHYYIHPYLSADLKARTADSIAYTLRFISNYMLEFSGQNVLTPESQSILDFMLEQLNKAENIRLIVAVHENRKGSDNQNQEQTNAISKAVQEYFLSKNIEPEKFILNGYGSDRPVNPIFYKQKDQNKRIEFIYMNE